MVFDLFFSYPAPAHRPDRILFPSQEPQEIQAVDELVAPARAHKAKSKGKGGKI